VLLALLLLYTVMNNLYQYKAAVCALEIKTAISGVMYRKVLRMDSTYRQRFDSAKLISMITVDTLRIETFITQLHNMWSSPFRIAIVFCLIAREIG
jgi:ATP-binding cassette subfamily C (CFTR/MRP) protein 1